MALPILFRRQFDIEKGRWIWWLKVKQSHLTQYIEEWSLTTLGPCITSSRPDDAYIHHWSGPFLGHVITHRQPGANTFLKATITYCRLVPMKPVINLIITWRDFHKISDSKHKIVFLLARTRLHRPQGGGNKGQHWKRSSYWVSTNFAEQTSTPVQLGCQ